jgi:flavin-binding protein dodecin
MAKKAGKKSNPIYRVTEIIGTSKTSWEDAARQAVEVAAGSLRDLRIAEVGKLDMKIEGGKVVAYRARVSLSFKYDV